MGTQWKKDAWQLEFNQLCIQVMSEYKAYKDEHFYCLSPVQPPI
jgi:hypothetical protein